MYIASIPDTRDSVPSTFRGDRGRQVSRLARLKDDKIKDDDSMPSSKAVDVVPKDVKELESLDSKDEDIENMQPGHDALVPSTPEDYGMQDDKDAKSMQSGHIVN